MHEKFNVIDRASSSIEGALLHVHKFTVLTSQSTLDDIRSTLGINFCVDTDRDGATMEQLPVINILSSKNQEQDVM